MDDLNDLDETIRSLILSTNHASPASIQHVDPDTQLKLQALIEAARKLTMGDSKVMNDAEIIRQLTTCGAVDSTVLNRSTPQKSYDGNCGIEEQNPVVTAAASVDIGLSNCVSLSLAQACTTGNVELLKTLISQGHDIHTGTDDGESLLSVASSAGFYDICRVLLEASAKVDDKGLKGDCTPLMEAASIGNVQVAKLLIDHGANVNAKSTAGNTALHYAACNGHEEVVRLLVKAGAHVEEHNENGHTPLMEAASAGCVGVAKIFITAGAGINTHSNEFKESALTLACYKGHLEMVRYLLEAGADQEHKTDEMHTALMEASMDGHVEVARLLLDHGAQVNMPADSFESPLTLAACGGHVELANLLLERGANIEEANDEGYTPLMEAAREGHEEMVALLLAHGADINAQTEETQETALTLACCGGFLEVADFLIKASADLELGCSTPLMEAAQEGHVELAKLLLRNGANVLAQTQTGDTALTYACENGHTDVAEVLLAHGAELDHEAEGGCTALMKAARVGHLCTVQFLISAGADVNKSTTNNEHTVLSLACAGGHLAVVDLLLKNGAKASHKLKDGSTMLIEAAKGGHAGVVNMLLDFGGLQTQGLAADELSQVQYSLDFQQMPRVPLQGLTNVVPPPLSHDTNTLLATMSSVHDVNSASYSPIGCSLHEAAGASFAPVGCTLNVNEFDEMASTISGEIVQPSHDFLSSFGGIVPMSNGFTWMTQSLASSDTTDPFTMQHLDHSTCCHYALTGSKTEPDTTTSSLAVSVPTAAVISGASGDDDFHKKCLQQQPQMGANTATTSNVLSDVTSSQLLLLMSNFSNSVNLAHLLNLSSSVDHSLTSTSGGAGGIMCSGDVTAVTAASPLPSSPPTLSSNSLHDTVLPLSAMSSVTTTTTAANKMLPSIQQYQLAAPTSLRDESSGDSNAVRPSLQLAVSQMLSLPGASGDGNSVTLSPADTCCHVVGSKGTRTLAAQLPFQSLASHVQLVPSSATVSPAADDVDLSAIALLSELQGVDHTTTATIDTSQLQELLMQHQQQQQWQLHVSQIMQQQQQQQPLIIGTDAASAAASLLWQQQQLATAVATTMAITGTSSSASVQSAAMNEQLMLQQQQTLLHHQQQSLKHLSSPTTGSAAGTSQQQQPQQPQQQQLLDPSRHASSSSGSNSVTVSCCPSTFQGNVGVTLKQPDIQQQSMASSSPRQKHRVIAKAQRKLPYSNPQLQSSQHQHQQQLLPSSGGTSLSSCMLSVLPPGDMTKNPQQLHHHHQQQQQQPSLVWQQASGSGVDIAGGELLHQSSTTLNNAEGIAATGHELNAQVHNCINAGGQMLMLPHQYRTSLSTDVTTTTPSYCMTDLNSAQYLKSQDLIKLQYQLAQAQHLLVQQQPTNAQQLLQQTIQQQQLVQAQKRLQRVNVSPQVSSTPALSALMSSPGATLNSGTTTPTLAQTFTPGTILPVGFDSNSGHGTLANIPVAIGTNTGKVPNQFQISGAHSALGSTTSMAGFDTSHLLKSTVGGGFECLGPPDLTTPLSSTPLSPNPSPGSPLLTPPVYQMSIEVDAQTEANHDTALTLACAGGHTELVTLLLSRGANIEHRDKKGFTPLIHAATSGHLAVCETLIEHGADLEAQSERTKDTALSLACSGGRHEIVELLLRHGANKEHRNVSDYTPLALAASGGYLTIIRLLLSYGAEINSRTGSKLGISPLMLAAMNGHATAVSLLADMGSDINAQIETNRNTALTLACFQGRHEVVGILIDKRANIEHRAKTGLTPLMEAASGGYVEVGRVLLDKGADINAAPVPSSRDTALTIAADKGHYRFVELLISRGAPVDVKNKKGQTALWLACNGGHLDVVQLLVSANASTDLQDQRKVSCLMAAFRCGHVKVVRWLVRHVTQFPSDTECQRFIASVTDNDLLKRCQQCMEIIISAKERQAAEANKNAEFLLEEIESERNREESRRVKAAKKREKKRQKKREKQGRENDAKCDGDDDERNEDFYEDDVVAQQPVPVVPTDPVIEMMKVCQQVVQNSARPSEQLSTAVSTDPIENNLHSDSKKSRKSKKNQSKLAVGGEGVKTATVNNNCRVTIPTTSQSEVLLAQLSLAESSTLSNNSKNSAPVASDTKPGTMNVSHSALNGNGKKLVNPASSQSSAKHSLDTSGKHSLMSKTTSTHLNGISDTTGTADQKESASKAKTLGNKTSLKTKEITSMSTGIGDLDDFGTLPSVPLIKPSSVEKDRHETSGVVATKVLQVTSTPTTTTTVTTSRQVRATASSVSASLSSSSASKSTAVPAAPASNKKLKTVGGGNTAISSSNSNSSSNTSARKHNDEDSSKKTVKVDVPAKAISRIIGRAGCNINAIRDASGALVDLDKLKDSADAVVTIKGLAEGVHLARSLVEALIREPDKDIDQLIPQMKKQPVAAPAIVAAANTVIPAPPPPSNVWKNNMAKSITASAILAQSLVGTMPEPAAKQTSVLPTAAVPSSLASSAVTTVSPAVVATPTTTTAASAEYVKPQPIGTFPIGAWTPVATALSQGKRCPVGGGVSAASSSAGRKEPSKFEAVSTAVSGLTANKAVTSNELNREVMKLQPPPTQHTAVLQVDKVLAADSQQSPAANGVASDQSISAQSSSSGDYVHSFNSVFGQLTNMTGSSQLRHEIQLQLGAIISQSEIERAATESAAVVPIESSIEVEALQAKAPGYRPQQTRTGSPRTAAPTSCIDLAVKPRAASADIKLSSPPAPNTGTVEVIPSDSLCTFLPFGEQNSNVPPVLSSPSAGSQDGSSSAANALVAGVIHKDEYVSSKNPMTLPRIGSNLNPNAPDFTSKLSNASMSSSNDLPISAMASGQFVYHPQQQQLAMSHLQQHPQVGHQHTLPFQMHYPLPRLPPPQAPSASLSQQHRQPAMFGPMHGVPGPPQLYPLGKQQQAANGTSTPPLLTHPAYHVVGNRPMAVPPQQQQQPMSLSVGTQFADLPPGAYGSSFVQRPNPGEMVAPPNVVSIAASTGSGSDGHIEMDAAHDVQTANGYPVITPEVSGPSSIDAVSSTSGLAMLSGTEHDFVVKSVQTLGGQSMSPFDERRLMQPIGTERQTKKTKTQPDNMMISAAAAALSPAVLPAPSGAATANAGAAMWNIPQQDNVDWIKSLGANATAAGMASAAAAVAAAAMVNNSSTDVSVNEHRTLTSQTAVPPHLMYLPSQNNSLGSFHHQSHMHGGAMLPASTIQSQSVVGPPPSHIGGQHGTIPSHNIVAPGTSLLGTAPRAPSARFHHQTPLPVSSFPLTRGMMPANHLTGLQADSKGAQADSMVVEQQMLLQNRSAAAVGSYQFNGMPPNRVQVPPPPLGPTAAVTGHGQNPAADSNVASNWSTGQPMKSVVQSPAQQQHQQQQQLHQYSANEPRMAAMWNMWTQPPNF